VSQKEKRHVTVHYFFETTGEVKYLLATGHTFTSARGEPLHNLDAIRLALRLDGEVWSR
jgi:hypothetical protein